MKNIGRLVLLPVLCGTTSLVAAPKKLSKAVIGGDLGEVKAQYKATPGELNAIDKWGWTPLMWAVFYRYLPITEYLLEIGADPNIQGISAYGSVTTGASPLIIAGYYGLDDQASLLLEKGAKSSLADGKGKTAMDYAQQYDFKAVVDLLVKKGAEPAVQTPIAK